MFEIFCSFNSIQLKTQHEGSVKINFNAGSYQTVSCHFSNQVVGDHLPTTLPTLTCPPKSQVLNLMLGLLSARLKAKSVFFG